MSDHYAGVVVTFEHDIKDEDAERLLEVLRHLHGVIGVEPQVRDVKDHMARARVDMEWRGAMVELATHGPSVQKSQERPT